LQQTKDFAGDFAYRCKMAAPSIIGNGNVLFSSNFGAPISMMFCVKINEEVLFAQADMLKILKIIDPGSKIFGKEFSRFTKDNTEFISGRLHFQSQGAIYRHVASTYTNDLGGAYSERAIMAATLLDAISSVLHNKPRRYDYIVNYHPAPPLFSLSPFLPPPSHDPTIIHNGFNAPMDFVMTLGVLQLRGFKLL